MARAEHYMKFMGDARLDGEGHLTVADEATAYLTEDDERLTRLELRGNSRMSGKPGSTGPQDMRAKDIDLAYAEDGRTLQNAQLVENASVQLPGENGKPGRRIAGKAIDIAMAPDGATVTNLVANENVQVDLPPDGETPARRIRSASLSPPARRAPASRPRPSRATSISRRARAASGKLAVDRPHREVRSHGHPDQARLRRSRKRRLPRQRALHRRHRRRRPRRRWRSTRSPRTRLDLSPGEGDTGRGPHVSDGRISVEAKNDPDGAHQPEDEGGHQRPQRDDAAVGQARACQAGRAGTAAGERRHGRPGEDAVDAEAGRAGQREVEPARLRRRELARDLRRERDACGRTDTTIKADKIVLDDKTGNLHATTNVKSTMILTEGDDKPAAGKTPAPKAPRTPPSRPRPRRPTPGRPSRSPTNCSTKTRSTARPTPAART